MESTRRKSELPNVNGGSSWSLPDVKNPIKILSRSMTSDTLLRNVNVEQQSGLTPPFSKSSSVDYNKEVVEKYVVKTICDKKIVVRQYSDAIIHVQHNNEHYDSPDRELSDHDEKAKQIGCNHESTQLSTHGALSSSVSSPTSSSSSRPGTPSLNQLGATNCYKFLESLYIGDLAIATNKQLLCKLNVEYVLNLCGVDITKFKSNISCLCSPPTSHAVSQMSLNININTSVSTLLDYFKEANQFINSARSHGKKVLLFEKEGVQWTGAFVIQYLMQYYKMKYYESKEFVTQSSIDFTIGSNLDSALRLWENEVVYNSISRSIPGTPTKDNGKGSRPTSVTRADNKKHGKQMAWT